MQILIGVLRGEKEIEQDEERFRRTQYSLSSSMGILG